MKVPVRRLPQTRVSEQQQGYARPVQPLDLSPLTRVAEGFRDQLLDEQDARQRVELNRQLLQEVNDLQEDFATRQTNPEISPIDFANTTNAAYTERHVALLNELRENGYSQDLLDDFDGRLGSVRQGFFERGLGHQMVQLRARSHEEVRNVGTAASQYAANNPVNGYATARDMVHDSIWSMPGLTEEERIAFEDEQLAIVRNGAIPSFAIQNPQLVIDTFDPQGLTAPHQAAPSTTGSSTVNTQNLDANRTAVATTLASGGLSPQVVAGFLGNFDVEGGYGGGQGDSGSASGIAQWREERRANFRQRFGKEPHQATVQEQAQFVLWELENPAAAGMTAEQVNAIRNADTAEEAAELIDRFYERSDGQHRARRREAAAGYAATAVPAAAPAPVQTASVLPVDLPPSTAVQQSDVPLAQNITTAPGLRVPGNIDLTNRPVVRNPDGTVSTVLSTSFEVDGQEVLVPMVVNGQVVSEAEARRHYEQTGEHLGIFDTAEHATAYAEQLHQEQARAAGVPASADISTIRTGNALLDDLNGPERIRLLSLAREQLNRVTATQRAEMDVTVQNYVAERMNGDAGTPLPAEQDVLRIYGPVEGPQRMAQMRAAEAARPAIIGFRTQSAADIQRALDALEPEPGSPTYATQMPIYEAAQRAAQALLTAREEDPAAYAQQHFPAVREAATQSPANYYAALDRAYEALGIDTDDAPVLSDEQTERLTRQYRDMPATQRREFLRQNFGQMGEDRFRRFARSARGTTMESDANMYALIRTYPGQGWGNLYEDMLEGRQTIAQDPARRPNPAEMRARFRHNAINGVGRLDANTSRAMQEMAEGLYVRWNGSPTEFDNALYDRALAAAMGGSLPVNMRTSDRVPFDTILPPRVNQQRFESWIERQTLESLTRSSVGQRPPRYGNMNAVPITDIINEGTFVMVAPGQYMIYMGSDGQPLGTSRGQPFIVNIDPREVVRPTGVVRGSAATRRAPTTRMGGGVM